MMAAIPESNHAGLRAVFERESQVFRGIRNKNIIIPFGILSFDVFRLVNIQGRISRVGAQESNGFINGLAFAWFQTGIIFQEDDFEVELEGRSRASEGVDAEIPGRVSLLTSFSLSTHSGESFSSGRSDISGYFRTVRTG
jgi:hypothetical protein